MFYRAMITGGRDRLDVNDSPTAYYPGLSAITHPPQLDPLHAIEQVYRIIGIGFARFRRFRNQILDKLETLEI